MLRIRFSPKASLLQQRLNLLTYERRQAEDALILGRRQLVKLRTAMFAGTSVVCPISSRSSLNKSAGGYIFWRARHPFEGLGVETAAPGKTRNSLNLLSAKFLLRLRTRVVRYSAACPDTEFNRPDAEQP